MIVENICCQGSVLGYEFYFRSKVHRYLFKCEVWVNKNYISTEVFPKELGRKIVKAEEIRHASDYDAFYIASKDVTVQQIETAERLLKLVSEYLKIE